MGLHSDTQIYATLVELAKAVIPMIRRMHRDVKQMMGGRILDEVLWMCVLIMRINKAPQLERRGLIEGLIEHLELAQVALRLCRELKYIAPSEWETCLPLVVSIGKQAYGWRDSFAPAT